MAKHRFYVDYEMPKAGNNAGVHLQSEGPFTAVGARKYAHNLAKELSVSTVRIRKMAMVEQWESTEKIK